MEKPFGTRLEAVKVCMQGFPIIHNHRFTIFHLGIISRVVPSVSRRDENPILVEVDLLGFRLGGSLGLDLSKRLKLEKFSKETSSWMDRCPATYPGSYLPIVPNEGPRLSAGTQVLVEVLPARSEYQIGDWVLKDDYDEISIEIIAKWHRIWRENQTESLELCPIPADELGPMW